MGLDNPLHILILVVVLLLIFGARRLPEIGRSLGSGMREFKESISGESKPPAPAPTQAPTLPAPPQQAQPQPAEPVAAQPTQAAPPDAPQ
jgi:sec-independent protein translocase protein TatA